MGPWSGVWLAEITSADNRSPLLGPVSQRVDELMMQMLWKNLAVKCRIDYQSGHNFAHVTTAELSWHVQIGDQIGSLEWTFQGKMNFHKINHKLPNPLWNGCTARICFPFLNCPLTDGYTRKSDCLHLADIFCCCFLFFGFFIFSFFQKKFPVLLEAFHCLKYRPEIYFICIKHPSLLQTPVMKTKL